ncbi:5453_t:CDS:1, partial [Funneliformis geosporum]
FISERNKKEAKVPNSLTIYRRIFIKTMELNEIPLPPPHEINLLISVSWGRESKSFRTTCKEISEQVKVELSLTN